MRVLYKNIFKHTKNKIAYFVSLLVNALVSHTQNIKLYQWQISFTLVCSNLLLFKYLGCSLIMLVSQALFLSVDHPNKSCWRNCWDSLCQDSSCITKWYKTWIFCNLVYTEWKIHYSISKGGVHVMLYLGRIKLRT